MLIAFVALLSGYAVGQDSVVEPAGPQNEPLCETYYIPCGPDGDPTPACCCFVTLPPRFPPPMPSPDGQVRTPGILDPGWGNVRPTSIDFEVAATGKGMTNWRGVRTFCDSTASPGDTSQGQNWLHLYLQELILATPGSPSSSDVTWRVSASSVLPLK